MIDALQTEEFSEELKGLQRNDAEIAAKLIRETRENPLRNSEIMVADYAGLRKRRKSRIRVLYAYCKDCRQRNDDSARRCQGCSDIKDETIIFFHVGLRGVLY